MDIQELHVGPELGPMDFAYTLNGLELAHDETKFGISDYDVHSPFDAARNAFVVDREFSLTEYLEIVDFEFNAKSCFVGEFVNPAVEEVVGLEGASGDFLKEIIAFGDVFLLGHCLMLFTDVSYVRFLNRS